MEAGKQQEYPGETFLTGVEQLIHKSSRILQVPGEKVSDEETGEGPLMVEQPGDHRGFKADGDTRGHRGGTGGAHRLGGKTALAKEIAGAENGHDALAPLSGEDGDLDPRLPKEVDAVGRVALREEAPVPAEQPYGSSLGEGVRWASMPQAGAQGGDARGKKGHYTGLFGKRVTGGAEGCRIWNSVEPTQFLEDHWRRLFDFACLELAQVSIGNTRLPVPSAE